MSEPRLKCEPAEDEADPILERLVRERLPGEIESAMMTGSDDAEISATERFKGEIEKEEALQLLDPERHILDTQPGG